MRKKKQAKTSGRTADEPGQTINVDLCFVPATHEVADKIPAVSGSSGRLKVQHSEIETEEREWPGRVFENPELSYEEAMLEFVAASREQEKQPQKENNETEQAGSGSLKAQKRALKREEVQLRTERQQGREARAVRKVEQQTDQALSKEQRRQYRQARRTRDEAWRSLREQRRVTLEQRKCEDLQWREKRRSLRERISQLPVITAWIAILVQCLGLPLFVAGANVTSEMIVEALRTLLPPELIFLISDRGTHFKAKAFKTLTHSEEFIHVLIARHRPESNGIAERFVRTLKEGLEDTSWQNDHQLALLLHHFLDVYNNRPHQGLAIPGLSPNEFSNRIWLL